MLAAGACADRFGACRPAIYPYATPESNVFGRAARGPVQALFWATVRDFPAV